MLTRTAAAITAAAAFLTCLILTTRHAERPPAEALLARGGFAELVEAASAPGTRVYLAPGTRLQRVATGVFDAGDIYLTETGLSVTVHPNRLLDDAGQRTLRAVVGPKVAFVVAPVTAPVEVRGGERELRLFPDIPYRAVVASAGGAVLAADLCDAFRHELRDCATAEGAPVLRPVHLGPEEVALLDLERLDRRAPPAPASTLTRYTLDGAVGLERTCAARALTVSREPVGGDAPPAVGAGGDASPAVGADRFLAGLGVDIETELETAMAHGERRAVRYVYARRDDGRPRRLATVTGCATGRLEAATFRDARGNETTLDAAEAVRAGATPGRFRFEASCPLAHVKLARALIGRGMAPEDAAWFLAHTLGWTATPDC